MTQPKTQAELQARVLEVLRREWAETYVGADGFYNLRAWSVDLGYVSDLGNVNHKGLVVGRGLDALAEASRLLRDGVAAPSRVDRALEVLRAGGYSDAHVRNEVIFLSKDVNVYLDYNIDREYRFESNYGVSLLLSSVTAIAAALEILNENGGGE